MGNRDRNSETGNRMGDPGGPCIRKGCGRRRIKGKELWGGVPYQHDPQNYFSARSAITPLHPDAYSPLAHRIEMENTRLIFTLVQWVCLGCLAALGLSFFINNEEILT